MKVYEFLLQVEFSEESHLAVIDFGNCITNFKATIVRDYHFLSDAFVDKIIHTSIKHSERSDPTTWEAEVQLASFMLAIGYQIGLENGSLLFHKWPVILSYACNQEQVSRSKTEHFQIAALQFLLNTWRSNAAITYNSLPDSNLDLDHYHPDNNELVAPDLPIVTSCNDAGPYESFDCAPLAGHSFAHYDGPEERLTPSEYDIFGENSDLENEARENIEFGRGTDINEAALAMCKLSASQPAGEYDVCTWMDDCGSAL